MPTDEARAGILELMNANGAQVGCLAVVIKGAGFQRSALQSAHTGMHLASTKTFEMVAARQLVGRGTRMVKRRRGRTTAPGH
jgi:hypothetical protein